MFSFKYLHKNKINSRPTMNCWVVICECKSFPFSASTPFPAVGVFLLRQLHFFLNVSSSPHSVCKVLLESCPRGPSAGLKLGLQCKYFIFQIASSDILSGQCQAGHSLYTVNAVQLRGVFRSASVSGSFFTCHLQILLSPTQSDFLHCEVAGSKVLYTMKYLH